MTTLTSPRPAVNNAAGKPEKALVAAAARMDLQVVRTSRWPIYLLNGVERADIRPFVVKLLEGGVLAVVNPAASVSLILPPHMIGA